MYAVCTKGGTGVNNLLLPDPQLCHMTLVCHKHHCFSEVTHQCIVCNTAKLFHFKEKGAKIYLSEQNVKEIEEGARTPFAQCAICAMSSRGYFPHVANRVQLGSELFPLTCDAGSRQ